MNSFGAPGTQACTNTLAGVGSKCSDGVNIYANRGAQSPASTVQGLADLGVAGAVQEQEQYGKHTLEQLEFTKWVPLANMF